MILYYLAWVIGTGALVSGLVLFWITRTASYGDILRARHFWLYIPPYMMLCFAAAIGCALYIDRGLGIGLMVLVGVLMFL
jgi:uncharacterized membrane protein